MMCVTTLKSGTLSVRTLLGQATSPYDSDSLLLPPFIRQVTPALWDTTALTLIRIEGDRCVCGVGVESGVCVGWGVWGVAVCVRVCTCGYICTCGCGVWMRVWGVHAFVRVDVGYGCGCGVCM